MACLCLLFLPFLPLLTHATRVLGSEVELVEPYSDVIGQETLIVGGQGGTYSQLDAFPQGKAIEKIGLWCADSTIKAIKLWLSGENDDQAHLYGSPDNKEYHEYAFSEGEHISSMSLWGNGAGSRAGWLSFTTNKGGSFSYGMTVWGRKQEYRISTYSGILAGAFIRSGADIDALGFYFLLPISSAQLVSINYSDLSGVGGIHTETLDEYTNHNNGDSPISWKFIGGKDHKTFSSWTFTAGVTATLAVSVKAGIPDVVETSAGVTWSVTASATRQTYVEDLKKLSWEQSGTLDPGKSIVLRAVTHAGNLDVPYQGVMQVVVNTGAWYSYSVSGTYRGVDATAVRVVAE